MSRQCFISSKVLSAGSIHNREVGSQRRRLNQYKEEQMNEFMSIFEHNLTSLNLSCVSRIDSARNRHRATIMLWQASLLGRC